MAATAALVGCSATGGTARQASPSGTSSGTPGGTLVLATTTSTQDSGLLDTLVPDYETGSRCRVKTVAVGSGEALALGADGNADVLLVHSPAAEQQYMAQGHGLTREAVMHNDFVLLGPRTTPRMRRGRRHRRGLAAIAAAHAPFASRADQSGTNAKELSLWARAGVKPTGAWYIRTGQGMGETLTIASQKQAYTLSDRGTYLATKNLDLRIVSEGQPELLNPYHVIVVKHAGTNVGCAKAVRPVDRSSPTQQDDRPLRRRSSTVSRCSSRTPGVTAALMSDPVLEVLARSALVSVTRDAVALLIGSAGRHVARARPRPGPAGRGRAGQHRAGRAHRRRRAGRRAAALAQRTPGATSTSSTRCAAWSSPRSSSPPR